MIRGLFLCVALITIDNGSVLCTPKHRQDNDRRSRVRPAESYTHLAAKFDEVAELKIATRKSGFHLGEMITLDVALLNTSSRPLFFRKLSELQIDVLNSAGQPLAIQEYGVADRALVAGSFIRLQPGEILVRSFQLLAGCDKRAFVQFGSLKDDDVTVFRKGLFLNWGDACLSITQSQTYTLSVQLNNRFVLLPDGSGKMKTTVGTIKSNSLEIAITHNY